MNNETPETGSFTNSDSNVIDARTPETAIEEKVSEKTSIDEARIAFIFSLSDYDGTIYMRMEKETSNGKKSFNATGSVAPQLINMAAFYHLEGEWHEGKKGRIFCFDKIFIELPHERKMALDFLTYKGFCHGLPKKTAQAIIDKLGDHALEMIEQDPSCLNNIPGVGPTWRTRIPEAIRDSKGANQIFQELYKNGIRAENIFKLYSVYGSETVTKVYSDPYRVAEENEGVFPFTVADCIAWNHGLSPYAPFRVRAGIMEVLHKATREGHTYLSRYEIQNQAADLLSRKPDMEIAVGQEVDRQILIENIIAVLPTMVEEARVVEARRNGQDVIYLQQYAQAEEIVATKLKEIAFYRDPVMKNRNIMMQIPVQMPCRTGFNYSKEQIEAIQGTMTHYFSIITGGPGTGKTTVMAEIVNRHRKLGHTVYLAAPTAKAADRMKDVTGIEAMTIQRMLGFRPFDGAEFNAENPLPADVIIVDEFSMVDILLMKDLVSAICPGTYFVAIGDCDQLPSVGAGNVLEDMMHSGIFPVYRLSLIFRQGNSSSIPANAHAINTGYMPQFQYDFKALWLDSESIPQALIETVTQAVRKFYFRGIDDVRVITPLRDGERGSRAYSKLLREIINPPADNKPECLGFRVGDRVMQNVNNYELHAMNGDEGIVSSIGQDGKSINVTFGKNNIVTYTKEDIKKSRLEVSYAITVHKSQGSEYPVVVLVLPPDASGMMNRRLLYTAVTRAKEGVMILGAKDTLIRGISSISVIRRNSGLRELLCDTSVQNENAPDPDIGQEQGTENVKMIVNHVFRNGYQLPLFNSEGDTSGF